MELRSFTHRKSIHLRVEQGSFSKVKGHPRFAGDMPSRNGTALLPGSGAGSRVQEQLAHLIAETTTDAFVAIDPDNRVIYWNRGAEQLLGWSAEEIAGKSLDLIIPDDRQAHHRAGMRRLSDGQEPRIIGKTTQVTARHRDGRAVAVELSLTLWCDPSTGSPAGYASIMRDVSERRRLEEERDAYERQLEEQLAAVQATSDGVAITDSEGLFIFMNPAHASMFGFNDPAETIGLHWSTLYHPDEAERIEKIAVPEVFASGYWRGEARGLHRDGRIIEQEVSLAKSPNGGLVCTTRDVGERQRAMRERIRTRERLLLAERQEMIGRAISGLVHDFANLMSVITASTATLAARSQQGDRELARIDDAARQATAMLDKILAPDRDALPIESLHAKSSLESVAELTAVTLRPRHSIRLKLPGDDIELRADRTEFMRVLMNLCTNARDSLRPDQAGVIELSLTKVDCGFDVPPPVVGTIPDCPAALITVSDTGCGIAEEDLRLIFEPFETRKTVGTGLGLAVVSAVITKAGGCISVESGSGGTRFHLLWPLAGASTTACLPAVINPLQASLDRKRILVAEDNPAVLDLIAGELRKAGADVGPCESPVEALAVLDDEASNWDALVVDYDMPEMNGAELAAMVRERWPALPIVLCTALQEVESVGRAGKLFDGRVRKGSLAEDLPAALHRLLSSSNERVR